MTRLFVAAALCLMGAASAQEKPADSALIAKARAFVGLLAAGKFNETPPLMDRVMNNALPPERFAALWKDVIARSGAFQEITEATLERGPKFRTVHVYCRFERKTSEFRVVYDENDVVTGFFLGPSPANARAIEPPYVKLSLIKEENVEVISGEFRLGGTLTLPKTGGPFPVVVLVHGSGPNDRDETIGPNKVFRDIAWGFAMNGVASLRYDKRTKAFPAKFNTATGTYREETVDDAVAAVKQVAKDPRFDPSRVVVLGHSFGGTLAPLIAKEAPEVTGIVLMAASTEPLVAAVLRQMKYVFLADGELSDIEKGQLDALHKAAQDIADGKGESTVFAGASKHYLDALNAYDGPATADSLSIPMFVAQGERDYQVLASGSFEDWKKALAKHPNVVFKSYPLLDHLFMVGKGPSYPKDYRLPRNVSEEFVVNVAEWVRRLPK